MFGLLWTTVDIIETIRMEYSNTIDLRCYNEAQL